MEKEYYRSVSKSGKFFSLYNIIESLCSKVNNLKFTLRNVENEVDEAEAKLEAFKMKMNEYSK